MVTYRPRASRTKLAAKSKLPVVAILIQRWPWPQPTAMALAPWPLIALRGLWDRSMRRADLQDLHFHDLRHEATSRFFELGLNVVEVAAITGHKDLKMLQRYTHLRAEDLARKLQ